MVRQVDALILEEELFRCPELGQWGVRFVSLAAWLDSCESNINHGPLGHREERPGYREERPG